MKKILKTIACSFVALAIAFTAFFGPTTKNSASADETITGLAFYGSNIVFDNVGIVNGHVVVNDFGALMGTSTEFMNTSFSVLVENGYFKFGYKSYRDSNTYFAQNFVYPWQVEVSAIFNHNFNFILTGYRSGSAVSSLIKGSVRIGDTALPSLNMVSVEISSASQWYNRYGYDIINSNYNGSYHTNFNVVSYVDTTGWRFTFAYPTDNTSYSSSFYDYRKYFLIDQNDLSDNTIYQEGYDKGLIDGEAIGNQEGYNNGYSTGYDVGFGNGRNEGIQNANNYSFLGLFGAIVDAPLTGLRSLFNFEFLGINLLSFITSLLTIALITFVIKKLMGR